MKEQPRIVLIKNKNELEFCVRIDGAPCPIFSLFMHQNRYRIIVDVLKLKSFLLRHNRFPFEADRLLSELSLSTFPAEYLTELRRYDLDPFFFDENAAGIANALKEFMIKMQ